MNPKQLVLVLNGLLILGLSAWALQTINDDLLVTGTTTTQGDNLTGGNMSVSGGAQFGSTVSAPDYLGTIWETHAVAGQTCDARCNKYSTQASSCVEALLVNTTQSCSGTVPSGERWDCLCKT